MDKFFVLSLQLVAILAVLSVSCDKPAAVIPLPEHYWGEMHAMINDQMWVAEPYAAGRKVDDKYHITLIGDVYNGYWHVERLSITYIPASVGTYFVGQWRNDSIPYYLLTLLDFDVALGYYLVEGDQAPKGSVTILEYDEATKEVKGTFEGVIYKKNLPDSLVITDGYFHTKIYN
jgi:hypothetical protein